MLKTLPAMSSALLTYFFPDGHISQHFVPHTLSLAQSKEILNSAAAKVVQIAERNLSRKTK